jgi:hypothetical protein
MEAVAVVALERETGRLRYGFDVWNAEGKLVLRTLAMSKVLRRRASYFRVNATGKVYQLENRFKSVEIPASAIAWK